MSVIDNSLDYSKYIYTHGTYQLTKIIQNTGVQTQSLTAAGGNESIFEIPAKVFNFGRSSINFTLTPTALINNFNWMYVDGYSMIRQITLQTRSGQTLLDINEFNKYTNMTMRRENKLEDILTWDKVGGLFSGLIPSNAPAVENIRPNSTAIASNGKTNFLEPTYIATTVGLAPGASGPVGGPVINVQMDLDKIKNTLIGLDKDLYFNGEILQFKIVWDTNAKMLFNSTVNTNVLSVPAPPGPLQPVAISNIEFWLAVEINPVIENMIKSKCASAEGLSLLMPYVYYNRIPLNGTSQTATVKYQRANGSKLLKLYWSVYNNNETGITVYDHNNLRLTPGVVDPAVLTLPWIPGAKVQSFYTNIDNDRTSQFNYNCLTFDDYKVKQDTLRGSGILSSDEYYYNWVWVEDFTDNNPVWRNKSVPEENCITGLSLDNERIYTIYSTTTNANYNHYIYAVCQKLLIISPAGIVIN